MRNVKASLSYADWARHDRKEFRLGIVGGIGPAATVDFMSKIVRNTPASSDQEHLRMLVEHNPRICCDTQKIPHSRCLWHARGSKRTAPARSRFRVTRRTLSSDAFSLISAYPSSIC